MILGNDPSGLALAADAQGVDRLKHLARNDPQAAVRETARQFEALLMGALLKSMRETTSQDGLFDSEQSRLYTSLLDQQLAQTLSKKGIGLAQVLERQLAGSAGIDVAAAEPGAALAMPPARSELPAIGNKISGDPVGKQTIAAAVDHWGSTMQGQSIPAAALAAKPAISAPTVFSGNTAQAPAKTDTASRSDSTAQSAAPMHVRNFIERMLPHAQAAADSTGIPARFMIGHAALESGWGRHEIVRADGSPSHNLFGIKADRSWRGDVAEVMTTEYIGGVPVRRMEQFRAYESYDAAFRDYGNFLKDNPRYADALEATHSARAYARELQQAGYASDPRYAEKLASVIDGQSLRRTTLA